MKVTALLTIMTPVRHLMEKLSKERRKAEGNSFTTSSYYFVINKLFNYVEIKLKLHIHGVLRGLSAFLQSYFHFQKIVLKISAWKITFFLCPAWYVRHTQEHMMSINLLFCDTNYLFINLWWYEKRIKDNEKAVLVVWGGKVLVLYINYLAIF